MSSSNLQYFHSKNIEIRSIIKYYWFKGKKPVEIREINNVYGKGTVTLPTIITWLNRYKNSEFSIFDRSRCVVEEKQKV